MALKRAVFFSISGGGGGAAGVAAGGTGGVSGGPGGWVPCIGVEMGGQGVHFALSNRPDDDRGSLACGL